MPKAVLGQSAGACFAVQYLVHGIAACFPDYGYHLVAIEANKVLVLFGIGAGNPSVTR
jgi:hypothetical protein